MVYNRHRRNTIQTTCAVSKCFPNYTRCKQCYSVSWICDHTSILISFIGALLFSRAIDTVRFIMKMTSDKGNMFLTLGDEETCCNKEGESSVSKLDMGETNLCESETIDAL